MFTWKRGEQHQLSKNFSTLEFECPCDCIDQRISLQLIDNLQKVRDAVQDSIVVTSGYRCSSYQEALTKRGYQTAKNSQHLLGNAADIWARNLTKLELEVHKHFMATGIARSFIHVDERRDKIRLWQY